MPDFFAAGLGRRGGAETPNVFDWSALLAADAPKQQAPWSAPEAFLAVLFFAVTCDGELAAVEHEALLALAHRSPTLRALSPAQLAELNVRIVERLREDTQALRKACEAIPDEVRLPLFAQSMDLLLSDGELSSEEADFLNTLIISFKLNRDDVQRIADVIVLKNQA